MNGDCSCCAHRWVWRAWIWFSTLTLLAIVTVSVLALSSGYWVFTRFGYIPAWLIVTHMFEPPSVLPWRDIMLLGGAITASLTAGVLVAVAHIVVCREIKSRHGALASCAFSLAFALAFAYGATGVFDALDGWFAIRNEIRCRSVKSDYFAKNFHLVNVDDILFPGKRKNLLVIISESLEEGFAEGAIDGANLLPNLTRWRYSGYSADYQCQVEGSSFTSAALTSLFYGIPRLRLDGSMLLQNTGLYPRFSIPSLWDVFLDRGYECSYVQGGDFEFGSKGRMFPARDGFRMLGFEDMRRDPDYLAEPHKHEFGVNDEVMFKYFKAEAIRLSDCGRPFVLFGLTMNTHCPSGWCSAFAPKGDRDILAESILAQDRMIGEFLAWFGELKCADDTVVVVLGDHQYWLRKFEGKSPRRVFNAVHIPGATSSPFKPSRRFATFDWAPTFIELAGGELPDGGHFGMGVSLLRNSPTLLDDIEVSHFDDEMRSSLSDYWDIVLRRP